MFSAKDISKHIFNITGVKSCIISMKGHDFETSPDHCTNCCNCDYLARHLHSASEAERWGNKYIYYCNGGYAFIAIENKSCLETLITGPLRMEDDDGLSPDIPVFTTKAVNSISDIIYDAFSFYEDEDKNVTQSDILSTMYGLSSDLSNIRVHLKYESELESAIMLGDKSEAKEVINNLLGYIFLTDSFNFSIVKSRIIEFIVLLSRSIIKSGANSNELFSLSSKYIKAIDSFNDIDRLSVWVTEIVYVFLDYVIDLKEVKNKDIVYKIQRYIKNNYLKKITLTEVAEHVYLSNSYLSKIIKEELGISFTEYVNKLRVTKSQELLRTTSLSLVEISNLVGFEDQSYFTKVFKKMTGISPGKYREKRFYS